MSTETHVKGLADIQKLLNTLPAKIEANVLRGALRAGAKPVLAQAVSNVPVQSGDLRDSLKISTRSRRGVVSASVKTKMWYAKFIEYGTKAHNIAAKVQGWLSFGGIFAKSVMHPGAKPHKFMRPALDSQAVAAVNAAAQYMRKKLQTKHGIDTSDIKLEGDE